MSGFSARHAFQAPTRFLSIATCSSFAIGASPKSSEERCCYGRKCLSTRISPWEWRPPQGHYQCQGAEEAPSLTVAVRDGDGNMRSGRKNARGAGRTKEWNYKGRQKWRDTLDKESPIQ